MGTSNAEMISLASELDGGRTYVMLLKVLNFLGVASTVTEVIVTRDSLPIPTITIAAPPLLRYRAADSITLQAAAQLASCFADGALRISFVWTNTGSSLLSDADPRFGH